MNDPIDYAAFYAANPADTQRTVRAFAALYPTPNVKRLLAACEDGTIRWADAERIAHQALSAGLREVTP